MFSKKDSQDEKTPKKKEHSPELHQSPSVYLVNDAIEDFAKRGGFDDLTGMGKPLDVPEGDVLSGVLKNANYLPPWVELRKEIAAEMKLLIESMNHISPTEVEIRIGLLNEKIKNYNKKVPNPVLQKGFVSEQTLETKYENHWR